MCRGRKSELYIFLEHKAAEQCSGLFRGQVIEKAIEHHLCQQELVCTAKTNRAGTAFQATVMSVTLPQESSANQVLFFTETALGMSFFCIDINGSIGK